MDTIFALSSGAPPAAIAVVRISGPRAGDALKALAGRMPAPRVLQFATLRSERGELLDRALVAWLPGPNNATGEDLAELHLHGGRAVVAAVEVALGSLAGLRRAEPGEFTRRAFANGRIDLAEAEGLADLLAAETELQRAAALAIAGGALSRQVADWQTRLLLLSGQVEAALDFGDEDGAGELSSEFGSTRANLAADIAAALSAPSAEFLRQGYRVALAGPPNAGKSTLFNALLEYEAAIATPVPGTTRDVLERPVALGGVPFTLIDMAGLRDTTDDAIEALGIERAHAAIAGSDLILWLGPEGAGPAGAWEIEAEIDCLGHPVKAAPRHQLSAFSGEGLPQLIHDMIESARGVMPKPGQVALSRQQRDLLETAANSLREGSDDLLIVAENLRAARMAFDRITGRAATEDMLDALFARFCLGK